MSDPLLTDKERATIREATYILVSLMHRVSHVDPSPEADALGALFFGPSLKLGPTAITGLSILASLKTNGSLDHQSFIEFDRSLTDGINTCQHCKRAGIADLWNEMRAGPI